jgi:hypothetical protein
VNALHRPKRHAALMALERNGVAHASEEQGSAAVRLTLSCVVQSRLNRDDHRLNSSSA